MNTHLAATIIGHYQRHAHAWAKDRGQTLFERSWLDRFLRIVPPAAPILDLGCGSGDPIARHLAAQGHPITGIDAAPAMIDICRASQPSQDWRVADMRHLHLRARYAGILAWNSFFHLAPDDQRAMFPIFAEHAEPGAALLFTSGPDHGEAIGDYRGDPLYHASLAPAEYTSLLHQHAFHIVCHIVEDPGCGHHTIWLAQRSQP